MSDAVNVMVYVGIPIGEGAHDDGNVLDNSLWTFWGVEGRLPWVVQKALKSLPAINCLGYLGYVSVGIQRRRQWSLVINAFSRTLL